MDGDSSDDDNRDTIIKINIAYLYQLRYRYAFLRL